MSRPPVEPAQHCVEALAQEGRLAAGASAGRLHGMSRHWHVNRPGRTARAVSRRDGRVSPGLRLLLLEKATCSTGGKMTFDVEGVVDAGVRAGTSLARSGRLEALHLSFLSSDLLKQLPHQEPGGLLVPSRSHQQIEGIALAVHGPPQPPAAAADRVYHRVQMPLATWPRSPLARVSCEQQPEVRTHRRTVS